MARAANARVAQRVNLPLSSELIHWMLRARQCEFLRSVFISWCRLGLSCWRSLMIILLVVDGPDAVFGGNAVGYILYCGHCCQHRVVLVIVPMYIITSHKLQIINATQELTYDFERFTICRIINRIGFRHPDHSPILDIRRLS